MRRCAWILLWAIVPLAGCSSGAGTDEKAGTGDTKTAGAGADRAVFDFLKAVQTGDDEKAANMLTKLARQKTEELDMVVAPPGSQTASFEVGEVEMIQEGGAYVSSTWTDVDDQGQSHSDQIVWVLRKEPEGWRIAGMVTKLFDNKLVLNFEDPEDMLRKQQLAEEEMQRRNQQPPTTAAKPVGAVETPMR